MMRQARFAIIAMLTLALSSCSQIIIESLGVESGDLLFRDGFSDTRSGWDRVQDAGIVSDYAGGAYRMFIDEPNIDIWSNPGLEFDDVIVEVDATKAGGPDLHPEGSARLRGLFPQYAYMFMPSP